MESTAVHIKEEALVRYMQVIVEDCKRHKYRKVIFTTTGSPLRDISWQCIKCGKKLE